MPVLDYVQPAPQPPVNPANYAPSANMAVIGLTSGISIAKKAIAVGVALTAIGVVGTAFSTSTVGQVFSAAVAVVGVGVGRLGWKRLKEMQEWL